MKSIVVVSVLVTCIASCATISTHPVQNLSSVPDGVRVYAPKIYLLVDKGQNKSTIVNLPDYSRAYDVKPFTLLAKQDFNLKMDVGQISDLTSNQDTTAILSFVKEAAQIGAKAGGLPASTTVIDGSFGFESGIYVLKDDGTWQSVSSLKPPAAQTK